MTVKEFYEWAVENHIEDFELRVDKISVYGCFTGYEPLTPEKTDISYSEMVISLG